MIVLNLLLLSPIGFLLAPSTPFKISPFLVTHKPCTEHQHRVNCPGCNGTCESLINPPRVCPIHCVVGGTCVCDEGYYMNDDLVCVTKEECPCPSA